MCNRQADRPSRLRTRGDLGGEGDETETATDRSVTPLPVRHRRTLLLRSARFVRAVDDAPHRRPRLDALTWFSAVNPPVAACARRVRADPWAGVELRLPPTQCRFQEARPRRRRETGGVSAAPVCFPGATHDLRCGLSPRRSPHFLRASHAPTLRRFVDDCNGRFVMPKKARIQVRAGPDAAHAMRLLTYCTSLSDRLIAPPLC